jgi:hypothetical protein
MWKLLSMLAVLGVGLAAVLGGCGDSNRPRRFGSGTDGTRADNEVRSISRPRLAASSSRPLLRGGGPRHVAVIVMENKEYGEIIGSAAAPFINGLARRYALARAMDATSHPSLPNYLALTGGSTFGINSDCTDCSVAGTSIVDQLERGHISWKAYMENLPYPCFKGATAGEYAKKHDPFVYYSRVANNRAWCSRVFQLSQLSVDERAGALSRFIWITPNLCHDMHDCSVATGDRFLSSLVPSLLRSLGAHGALFITWDEGTSDSSCCRLASGGRIATIVAGRLAKQGAELSTPTDHYSLLATIEGLLGLDRLRGAACPCTSSLKPLLAEG